MTLVWILLGALAALGFVAFVRKRRSLAVSLVVVALVYIAFAVLFHAPGDWWAYETAGVLIFGVFAFLGVRYGFAWLALGWGLHILWDVVLHSIVFEPSFVPRPYPFLCLGFDLVVAVFCVLRLSRDSDLSQTTPIRKRHS